MQEEKQPKTKITISPRTINIDSTPITEQCRLQNNADYRTMPITKQRQLQNNAVYKTMLITEQRQLQNNADYRLRR